ncbi:hypothetical protein [Streptomyces sp. NPDC046197]|uniref:sensor histidine kinase n=1 Tax=Streptomyces sp. NPDC046197 TaxID=3154337 RepID=UPI0033DDC289
MTGDATTQVPPVFARRRWLLPSAVADELDPDAGRTGRSRRTARDWAVDFSCFLLAVAIGLAAANSVRHDPHTPYTLAVVDQLLGALAVPASVGRTAYRIAQEGLTNARKHAPGTEVTVTVTGAPGEGLVVSVRNPAPEGEVPPVPGSGQGLIGLTERATLAGGTLQHGPTPTGGFETRAGLPWGEGLDGRRRS